MTRKRQKQEKPSGRRELMIISRDQPFNLNATYDSAGALTEPQYTPSGHVVTGESVYFDRMLIREIADNGGILPPDYDLDHY